MCDFETKVIQMTFGNCHLFKRSFTNKGIGYTFNNERNNILMKEDFRGNIFFPNFDRIPSLMKSASLEHSLKVVIESNAEEVERYEKTIDASVPNHKGHLKFKPKSILVSLHNPVEPADIRSSSFEIPLGHSTTVYIKPVAREIDESGKTLSELERHCRLDKDTEKIDIFNVYTRAACMFECKIKFAIETCGCVPWNYPFNEKDKVL